MYIIILEEFNVTNLKTKEEMYKEYLNGIAYLEKEVRELEQSVRNKQIDITQKKARIEALKETAEIYKPKLNYTINISSPVIQSTKEIEKIADALKSELDKHTTTTWSKVASPNDYKAIMHAGEVVLPRNDDWSKAINNQEI